MLPPVRPKRRSRSSGESTWRAITERLKLGAYWSRMSKQRSANASFTWSQPPSRSWYGAYCTKNDITCLPGGATVESTTDGIVHSRIGLAEGRPYLDRKSTRLNSSHGYISYAVFCLKKKETNNL